MAEHTKDEIKQAIKHKLKTDLRAEPEDDEIEIERTADEGSRDYIHARVNYESSVNVYRNSRPSYIQNYRLGSDLYDLCIVAEPEELELEG